MAPSTYPDLNTSAHQLELDLPRTQDDFPTSWFGMNHWDESSPVTDDDFWTPRSATFLVVGTCSAFWTGVAFLIARLA